MRSDLISFVLGSANRKKIVTALLEYPQRQWSCSALEEVAELPHATTFRALQGLHHFGLLKSTKINKKDLLYELVSDSPLVPELQRFLTLEQGRARQITRSFVSKVKSKQISAIILYGSGATGKTAPESDIDILVVIPKHHAARERFIHDQAGELSSKFNKTISAAIMTKREIERERKSQFMQSVKSTMELLYGKTPF